MAIMGIIVAMTKPAQMNRDQNDARTKRVKVMEGTIRFRSLLLEVVHACIHTNYEASYSHDALNGKRTPVRPESRTPVPFCFPIYP